MENTTATYPHGKNYYIFLVAYLVGLSAFGSFVNDMYLPTLPEMTRYFQCPVSVIQLGLTMGMLGLGIGQLILGPASDKYGRKPVLMTTMTIFIIGAVVSIFSPDIHFFLGCRFVQGIGASGGYFLARTIPADIFSGRQLAKTMALIGAINGFAPASAPVLGGILAVRTTLTFFVISSINLSFLFVKAMTNGGPDGATEVFLSYMYQQAYTNSSYGYGMAIGVLVFAFSFALSAVVNVATKREPLEF